MVMEILPNIPNEDKSIYSIDLMGEYNPIFRIYIKDKLQDTYQPLRQAFIERTTNLEISLTARKAPYIEFDIHFESMYIEPTIIQTATTNERGELEIDLTEKSLTSAIDIITSSFALGKYIKVDYGYINFHTKLEDYAITDFKMQLKNGGIIATIIAQKLGNQKSITYPSLVYSDGTMFDVLRDLLYRSNIELKTGNQDLAEYIDKYLIELEEDIAKPYLDRIAEKVKEKNRIAEYASKISDRIDAELELDNLGIGTLSKEDIDKKRLEIEKQIVFVKSYEYQISQLKLEMNTALSGIQEIKDIKSIKFDRNNPFVVPPATLEKTIRNILTKLNLVLDDKNGIKFQISKNIKLSYGKPKSEIKSISFKTENLEDKARYSHKPQITRSVPANTPSVSIPSTGAGLITNNSSSTPSVSIPNTTPAIPSTIPATVSNRSSSTGRVRQAFEQAKINTNATKVLTASIELLAGYPAIFPLDVIELDLGNSFYTGKYAIDNIQHSFDDSGYKTKLELNKTADKNLKPKQGYK
jgi:hypothetical protein